MNGGLAKLEMDIRKMKEFYYPYEVIIPEQDQDITFWYETIESKLVGKIQTNLRNKIIANKICFVRFHSPAFTYVNFKNLFGDYEHIIMLDVIKLKTDFNNNVELIFPILLHEIGHLFNVPEHNGILEDVEWIEKGEFYADDFVRKLGFEKELLQSLEYYHNLKKRNKEKIFEILELRLKRLTENDELKIGIDINTFNKNRDEKSTGELKKEQ